MNLSFVDQGVSYSPSWIRGGAAGAAGALILSKIYFEDKSYSSGASRHLPYLRGGVVRQHFICIDHTLNRGIHIPTKRNVDASLTFNL